MHVSDKFPSVQVSCTTHASVSVQCPLHHNNATYIQGKFKNLFHVQSSYTNKCVLELPEESVGLFIVVLCYYVYLTL